MLHHGNEILKKNKKDFGLDSDSTKKEADQVIYIQSLFWSEEHQINCKVTCSSFQNTNQFMILAADVCNIHADIPKSANKTISLST